MNHLIACPGCSRHLRVSERACPFCAASIGEDLRARPAPRPPTMRLSRAALAAFGVGTLALSTACSSANQTEQVGSSSSSTSGVASSMEATTSDVSTYGTSVLMTTSLDAGTSRSSTHPHTSSIVMATTPTEADAGHSSTTSERSSYGSSAMMETSSGMHDGGTMEASTSALSTYGTSVLMTSSTTSTSDLDGGAAYTSTEMASYGGSAMMSTTSTMEVDGGAAYTSTEMASYGGSALMSTTSTSDGG